MANSFYNLQTMAREALPTLTDNLVFPGLMHRNYMDEAHDMGDTIRVRKPVVLTAQEFNAASGVSYQDMNEDTVPVTLNHLATVDVKASAVETATTMDDLNRVFIRPACAALAEKINRDAMEMYKDVYNIVGTAGVTPGTLASLAAVRKAMNTNRVPSMGRVAVWDAEADCALMQIPAIVNAEKSGDTAALREGSIGRVFGMDNFMCQAVIKHKTALTASGAKLGAATAAGDTTLALAGTSLSGHLVHGDLLTISGKTYTVTEDTEDAVNNAIGVVKVAPALPALAANTEVTPIGDHTANLAFHPDAFAIVMRPLLNPNGQGVESYVTSHNGISMRVTNGYDQRYKNSVYSMDVLYGFKCVYPELAVRVLG